LSTAWRIISAVLPSRYSIDRLKCTARLRDFGAALFVAFATFSAQPASAQLSPGDRWYTIETPHFRIHFIKALEPEARRGAVNAERAFAELSTQLRPPGGKVDLVIADNYDYVNGYATSFPTNRIVVFAHPPIDAQELRNYDDWSRLVITHELSHIFFLDRSDGLWRIGRDVFGRNPAFFPNTLLPSWLIEGLAVYYESRLTGAGRLEGPEHYMIARGAAEAHRFPRLSEISRVTSRFPGGESVYAYGGLLFDYLSRTRGPQAVQKFIDLNSRRVFPLSLNARAKMAFGISFENAYRDWSDSLKKVASPAGDPLPGWQLLTHDGRNVNAPRWLGDTAVVYAADNGRESPAAYIASVSGSIRNIGRRNGLGANIPLGNDVLVFSQPDFTDPFHLRNDLYVSRDGHDTQLTHGARLAQPDARADGEIVAVQSIPGTTRLVRVMADGKQIFPITTGTAQVQWGDPRWSPDGKSIAAVRVTRGGLNEILILDSAGAVQRNVVSERAIVATPSWSPAGDRIYYTSAQTGSMQAYVASASGTDTDRTLLSTSETGLFDVEPSRGGDRLAAIEFKFDGYHLGYTSVAPTAMQRDTTVSRLRASCTNCRSAEVATAELNPGPAHSYSPWQSLAPRYWQPLLTIASGSGNVIGATTSGEDVIGRHAYDAQAGYNTKYREAELFGSYVYAGLGQPFIGASAQQTFDHFEFINSVGDTVPVSRRARIYGLSMGLIRPRVRTYASLSFGAEIESRDYTTSPDSLRSTLPPVYSQTLNYPSLFASASWSNTQRPGLSISREDGIAVSATTRRRWLSGDASNASNSIVGVMAAYKSLDLPGFSHHALALRLAGATADKNAISTFSVGGLSGESLAIVTGISVGGDRRTFGVRGFAPSAEQGTQAVGGTVEYRAPIAAPSTRVPFIPLMFDRISVATFADAGRAYCPGGAGESVIVCGNTSTSMPWLASVGAEANLDTAIQYDVPARFRFGIAIPLAGKAATGARAVSAYLTIGESF
jgi:WD40 repeat protein